MIRIATFNVENLFARYRFRRNFNPTAGDGFSINNLAFDIYDETAKQITGKAIKKANADVIALQEVENLKVLDAFNSRYLGGENYKHRLLIDAFDPRNIDVALLSRYPIIRAKSHRQERNAANSAFLFSRDCLEVDINVEGKILTLYINHFKSMYGGRAKTKKRRLEQVERVVEIIDEGWKIKNYQGNFIALGDFNDYLDAETSLNALVTDHDGLINVSERLPEDERWTHFWDDEHEHRQLDYILLSKSLADKNQNATPEAVRKGLCYEADKYTGERFGNIGDRDPKASDHCPLSIEIDLE